MSIPNRQVGWSKKAEHVWGGNSHMANGSFYASGIYAGLKDPAKALAFQNWCEYYHGAVNTYPTYLCSTFDGTAGAYNDYCSWDNVNKAIVMPTYTYRNTDAGVVEGNSRAKFYATTTGVRVTAIEQRNYVMTKTKNVDADWNKFFRGVDYGVSAGTATNLYYFIELWVVDANGVETLIENQSEPYLDNIS